MFPVYLDNRFKNGFIKQLIFPIFNQLTNTIWLILNWFLFIKCMRFPSIYSTGLILEESKYRLNFLRSIILSFSMH